MTLFAGVPIVIGGPTAAGKSALALALAEELGGEIVCADSRQIYEGMRVASAAPDDLERARVPHHLYGTVAPEDTMTAGAWAARADAIVAEVSARGRVPIVVGGTGLYLRAWRVGLETSGSGPSDPAVRARLDEEAERLGSPALHARLREVDEEAAAAIEPADRLRIVRALEIFEVTGRPRGAVNMLALPPRFEGHWLLADAPLDVLEPRIRERAHAMFRTPGIREEAAALAARLPEGHRLLETLGTREALDHAAGLLSTDEAIARTTVRTRQYARRQRNWFKKEPWWRRLDASLVSAAAPQTPPSTAAAEAETLAAALASALVALGHSPDA